MHVSDTGTYSSTVDAESPPMMSSAILHYSQYLRSVYKNSPISPEKKWPPTPSREYVTLAMGYSMRHCRDKYLEHTLFGNIGIMLGSREEISIEGILKPRYYGKISLVLMEGAPGIGKSTLAWELCRKWEEFPCMKKYQLVILLRLREEEAQRIESVGDLFYSYECENKKSLVDEVIRNQGDNILFILDGFDELPETLQKQSYLLNLISGVILPESTVLVTSRPSATAELLSSCRPRIQKQKHIEILGFTQESVEKYASSIFSSEPERLEKFKTYISMSKNPAINSLMYVPLNAAIITEIYRSSSSDDVLPHTLTELYTQISLTILNRHLATNYPSVTRVDKFENLPTDLYRHLLDLSKLAFEGVRDKKITFQSLPPSLVHFGLFDAVSALYGGGSVSYNFLHLTLQEFFAAYYACHIARDGLDVIGKYGLGTSNTEQWNIVWRFIAGLTGFKPHEGQLTHYFESQVTECNAVIDHPFLVQCIFEAKTTDGLKLASKLLTFNVDDEYTAFDAYALGYCISNLLPTDTVHVAFHTSALLDEGSPPDAIASFPWGLKVKTSTTTINKFKTLTFKNCVLARRIANLETYPWQSITTLCISDYCMLTNSDMVHLSELIPHMVCLEKLEISSDNYSSNYYARDGRSSGFIKVLEQLANSNVTALNIAGSVSHTPVEMAHAHTVLMRLIDPLHGRLETLILEPNGRGIMELICSPSSLKTLVLCSPMPLLRHAKFFLYVPGSLSDLKHNIGLTRLILRLGRQVNKFATDIAKIVASNKTLLCLSVSTFHVEDKITDEIMTVLSTLHLNTTLQSFELFVTYLQITKYEPEHYMKTLSPEFKIDSRISWKNACSPLDPFMEADRHTYFTSIPPPNPERRLISH